MIIDLAVEARRQCHEGAKADETVDIDGVKIIGYSNMAGRVAVDASALYARNLLNFIQPLVDKEKPRPLRLKLDWDDEILKAVVLTRHGEVVYPDLPKAAPAAKKAATKKPPAKKAPAAKKPAAARKTPPKDADA